SIDAASEDQKWLVHARNRLMASIPRELLQTKEGRALRDSLDKLKDPPRNEPLLKFESTTAPYSAEEFLRDRGAAVEDPVNARILEGVNKLQSAAAKVNDQSVTTADIAEWIQRLKDVKTITEASDGADPKVLSHAATEVSSLALRMVRNSGILDANQKEFV